MGLELRHLRYFVAVAEEGHITRAAERLGIQQPPLSKQIKSIEQALGVQLFLRKARGVELTEAGSTFLAQSRTLLADLERALESTKRTGRGEQGRICLGVAPTAPFHPFVPRVIRAFRERFPKVTLSLEECLSAELLERLRDQKIDVAFIRTDSGDFGGLAIYPLLEEDLLIALPSAHALARGDVTGPLSLKRLAGETFILYGPPGSGIHDRTIAACRAAGFSPRIGQLAPRITSTLNLVAAGLGLSLVPASMQRLNLDGVTYRQLKGSPLAKANLSLVARRDNAAAVVRHFLDLARTASRSFGAGRTDSRI